VRTIAIAPRAHGPARLLLLRLPSFNHPDFLAVSMTHGAATLGIYDQAMWDKYELTRLAGEKFKTNTLIVEQKAAAADPANYEDPAGVFSGEDNSIPALMRRGVVFMACHNGIWEQAAALIKANVNPDKLSQAALAAELTNHLVDGVVRDVARVAASRLSLRKIMPNSSMTSSFAVFCSERPPLQSLSPTEFLAAEDYYTHGYVRRHGDNLQSSRSTQQGRCTAHRSARSTLYPLHSRIYLLGRWFTPLNVAVRPE
jgi:hypothetical protein